jgi:O-antigen/teichoic acid export membrane protein
MGIACAASAVVFCLPQEFYDFIFQRKIEGLKITLLWLIPGLIANAASIIYAHYFSGTGKQRYNMMASLLGLIAGLGFGIAFIPKWGLAAAAMSTSIAFSVQAIYFFIQYRKTKIEA